MCVHHTKNYWHGLLRLIEFEARGSVSMDREERLRRRWEQARLRRAAETSEQREARLARRRQYERARRAALNREQREAMNQVRTSRQINNPPQITRNDFRNCTIDDERHTDKIKEFHRKLFAIEAVLCLFRTFSNHKN